LGVDVFSDYVEKINNKTLFSPEPSVNKMLNDSINFNVTTNFDEVLVFSDIIFICRNC
jgi:UDP-glucose 6-dehydrogenase